MKGTSERWGLSLEIIVMCILLLATFWESEASGWWDNASREMQYHIQEKANLAILDSNQQIIFSEMKSMDDQHRYEQLVSASEKIAIASRELIEERNQRTENLNGQ